jgi:bacteriorhodopsin
MKALPTVDSLQDYYDVTAGEINESNSEVLPSWAYYTIGLASGIVLVVALIGVCLFVRSRKSSPSSYATLKETDTLYTKQGDVPL